MRITPPHFANTLLFRLSATFLLLLGISLGGYYFWIENTVFNPYQDEEEERWYEALAEDEISELAARLAAATADADKAESLLVQYGDGVRKYDVEVVMFDTVGHYLASSAPDSLAGAVSEVSVQLLHDMSDGDWDYSTYPDETNIDAYENRLFEVQRIHTAGGAEVVAYLAASYFPSPYSATTSTAIRA